MNQKIKEKIFLPTLKQNIFLILALCVLLFHKSKAQQNKDFFFQKLTTFNGLSSNYIQCILRDSRGYVWIGTVSGLNRYDGKNIKVYHHEANNPHSLPRESIRQIKEDKNGILWLGADYGLIEFNPLTEQFNLYRHEAGNPKSLRSDHIPYPFVDSKNNLWVGTESGLQLFNRKQKTFQTFLLSDPESIKNNPSLGGAGVMAEDKEHNIWCSGAKGLYKFDWAKRELELFPFQNGYSEWASDIFIDHDENLWLVYWSTGTVLFHPENGKYEAFPISKKDRFDVFGKMCEWKDPDGVFWLIICTERGVLLYNPKNGENKIIQNDPRNTNSLIFNDIYYVYADQDNTLWIGTKKGLNILDIADQSFQYRLLDLGNTFKDRKSIGNVETIYEDTVQRMVAYAWSGGFGIYDDKWNLIRIYPQILPDTSHLARDIFSFFRDFRGVYWITTNKGLARFDQKKNQFKVFIPPEDGQGSPKEHRLMREIIPFDSSSFYIRTLNCGIYKFDFINNKFVQNLIHIDKDPTSLPTNYLRAVLKDGENRLIIISVNKGIFIYNPGNNLFEIFNHHSDASINDALNNLYYDPALSGNILWMNSAHGLLKFNLHSKRVELFDTRNGLANDFLLSNEVDNNGNVWVAHNAGISRFDTVSKTFTNYTENNGLAVKELNNNMKKMSDGNIYIGDAERLIYFNPDKFKANQIIPKVHINAVQVLNEPYSFATDSVTAEKTLTLTYDQDLITVDFSVLNFTHPNENRFYYRLDKESVWHRVNDGSVNLVRLSPGKYILHVTGSNDSGLMNLTGDSLTINILPPYYQTGWFRLILVIIATLIFFAIRRREIKRIKHEEQLKTEFNKQLAQAETKALRAQMNPHFIFNCLNSINSYIVEQKHEIASEQLIRFSKLIRLVLDNSRSETITVAKELETLKLYVLLESARYDNKFICIYSVDENVDINSIMIPPMLLQPYVENAIWHGLMQKEEQGTVAIEIKKQDEDFLKISISDDGIGRKKAAELKSKSATHKSHGLKVTSQRIEMMNKLNSTGAHVNIIDLYDESGHPTGTKVELIIPF